MAFGTSDDPLIASAVFNIIKTLKIKMQKRFISLLRSGCIISFPPVLSDQLNDLLSWQSAVAGQIQQL
jgi:hypothetical protein